MVNFGKSLERCRRRGWETAYLDYTKLKKIISELESSLLVRGSKNVLIKAESGESGGLNGGDDDAEALIPTDECKSGRELTKTRERERDCSDHIKDRFFLELGEEIEKISLFALKTQGLLSEAIGHLRFRDDDTIRVADLFPDRDSILRKHYCGNSTTGNEERMEDDLDMYLVLGVELLFLIQFVGVNTIGVRKALKKFNKITRRLHKPEYYYVMGGKDDFHMQQIGSLQSLAAIHSSLQSDLVRFFRTDRRLSTDPGREIQYFRFQSILQASYVIRKNSEIVNQPFKDFLSRRAMINVGSSLGGIEGSEKLAMNVVLGFRPATMSTVGVEELDAMWSKWIPQYAHWKGEQLAADGVVLSYRREATKYAMEVLEKEESSWQTPSQRAFLYGSKPEEYGYKEKMWGGVDTVSMVLNLLSILLYTINYYIVAPTANRYAVVLGADGAFGATLIGMSSFSAIISAFLYSLWYTKASFKSALVFSAVCPLLGNLVYSLAISYRSMGMAIGGRFLCGLGSAEVVNRQLISTCISFKQITRASAFFVASGAMGMSIGPLIAGILDETTGRDLLIDLRLPWSPAGGIIYNSLTSPGFVMAALWVAQLVLLIFFFCEPDRINGKGGGDEQDCVDAETIPGTKMDYGSIKETAIINTRQTSPRSGMLSVQDSGRIYLSPKKSYKAPGILGEILSTSSLILRNRGLPVTLLLFCYIELADELLISSCSMIVRRYFRWYASAAGFLVASLGALVLPANFVVEICSRRVSERRIMKLSICFIVLGCFGIFNYEGLYCDMQGISTYGQFDPIDDAKLKELELSGEPLGQLLKNGHEFPYDWGHGSIVYITFLSLIFSGTIVLEGVTTSIMAQVTPSELNGCFFNSGLLATLIGTIGRVLSDSMITLSALLDIHVFVDFVNAIFIPLLLLTIGCLILVRVYYDKLL